MSTIAATNLKNPSAGSNNIVLGTDGSTRVTTLADSAGANTSTPAEIASGRAKAWVNFNGTGTVAIRASYNVSSITDNGTGDSTVNFTTAMVDTNYAATFGGYNTGTGDGGWISAGNQAGPYPAGINTGSIRLFTYSTGGSAQDQQAVSVAIFR